MIRAQFSALRMPDSLTVQVSSLYGVLYLHYGVLTFLPLWLKGRDVADAYIGALMAIPLFLRLVAVAPVVAWAGRQARLRDALTLFALLAAISAASTGLVHDHLWLLIIFTLFSLAWDQLPVLTDSYAVLTVRARGLDFGRLRVWGSLGVVAGVSLCGGIFDVGDIGLLPWVAGGLLALLALVSRVVPSDRELMAPEEQRMPGDWKAVFADRQLIGAMIATSLLAGSHGMLLSFGAIQFAGQGWSTTTISMLISISVVSEVLVLWFGQKWLKGADPRILILGGCIAAILRWIGMASNPSLPVVFLLQATGALSAIMPLLGMMLVVARRSPAHLVGVAQGINAVIMGLGLAVVTLVSGLLWERGIPAAYISMACMAALAVPFVLGRENKSAAAASIKTSSEVTT